MALVVATVLFVAGCSTDSSASTTQAATTPASTTTSEAGTTTTLTSTPTTIPIGPVAKVAGDVRYAASVPAGWSEPLLDVYAPEGAEGLPLVVLFHGNPSAVDKEGLTSGGSELVNYPDVIREIAARGAVVVSANWGPRSVPFPADAAAFVTSVEQARDETACAISYAVEHAPDYGSDPSRLVVIGHSGGATHVSATVLGTPEPFPGCAADSTWTPTGVVFWEGDMLVEDPTIFDLWGGGQADVLAAFTPWGYLDSGFQGRTVFVVSDTSARDPMFRRCDGPGFLDARDPTGAIEAGLNAIGAFDDGCVDIREESAVTAAAMADRGFDTTLVALTDPASSHFGVGSGDLALFADLVIGMVGSGQ